MTHFGFANVTGRTEEALAHLRRVNGWDHSRALAHVYAAENLWIGRSARIWTLDLAVLIGAGITVRRPEIASERRAVAERALQSANANAWSAARTAPPLTDEPNGSVKT